MTEFFLKIVNMSISASWVVLAVLLLRLLLKKAPKWINVVLWGIVGLRLVMPFSLESIFSLIPSPETVSPQIMTDKTPQINTGVPVINNVINPVISESFTPAPMDSANPFQIWIPILAVVWVIGIVGMFLYTAISFWRVKRKIGTAILLRDNIYQSENVVSPFVLGLIKPKIYLPFNMNEQSMAQVIAHENAHISRKDHLWKPLGFLILTLHWFNPLMWLGYVLLCRDIELACDEKVVKDFNIQQKADYSQALLSCSVNRRIIAACPLAFGEVGVKTRIKSVLNYKKPAFWIIVVSVVASIVVSVCFLTNPRTTLDDELSVFLDMQAAEYNYSEGHTDGNFIVMSHKILDVKKTFNKTTVYMWSMYMEYSCENGEIENESGSHVPIVITAKRTGKHGHYELVEYWEPRDGTYYAKDIAKKFPWYLHGKALNSQRYVDEQMEFCENSAKEYFDEKIKNESDSSIKLSVNTLRKIYPQFFGVSTDGGLTVYVWQMAEDNYRCYLANSSLEAISDNSFAYTVKDSATIEEMKVILSSYDIDKNEITIQPVINPLSSYHYEITDAYKSKIKAMFFDDYNTNIPNLSVICNGAITEAVKGTLSWTSAVDKDLMQTVNGNSAHPLDRIEYLLSSALRVKRYDNTPISVSLVFDRNPDDIKVNAWFMGENGKTKAFDVDLQGFNIELNEAKESCIYEIVATWNKNDKAYGTVTYSFAVIETENLKYSSNIYTDDEIESAIKLIKTDFEKDWQGCTLKKIAYLGDDNLKSYQEFADRNNCTDVLVLTSEFYVAPTGAHGSLNADSTYTDYKWILVRNAGEDWKHVDHGYP